MKLKPISAALVAALSVGVLAACGPATPADDGESVLRIGLDAPVASFAGGNSGGFPIDAVYDQLLIEGPDYNAPLPNLAESYEYNDDYTVLTLYIRDDVDFQTGNHLDAEAIKINLDREIDPSSASSAAYAAVDEVVVTDEYTVEVRLKYPDDNMLTMMRIYPTDPEVLADPNNNLVEEPAGTGPYLLESATDTEYIFVRNENYWNPDAYEFDRIEMSVLSDLTARVNALKSGQVDITTVDFSTAPEVEAQGFDLHYVYNGWQGLLLGDRRGEMVPALADLRVRQAIQMSFDREGFNEANGGFGDTSNQVGVAAQAGTGYYLPELADELAYDPERAKELLAEAGYPNGFDLGDIPAYPGFPGDKYTTYMKQALADIGITVEFYTIDAADFATEYAGDKPVLPYFHNYWIVMDVVENGARNYWNNIPDAETVALLERLGFPNTPDWIEAREELTQKMLEESWYAILAHDPYWIWGLRADLQTASNFGGGMALQNIKND